MDILSDRTAEYASLQQRQAAIVFAALKDQLGGLMRDDPEVLEQALANRRVSRPVQLLIKSAVSSGLVSDSTFAGPLALPQSMIQAFLAAVDRQSVLGQLGAVRVPSTSAVGATQTAAATAYWVGESAPKPLSALAFAAMALPSRKLAADVPFDEELLRFGSADVLSLVERAVVSACASALDTALLDPANSGTANIKPPSLTNGLTTIPPLLDFQNQVGQPLAAISGGAPTKPVLIVNLQTALRLSALPNLANYVRVIVTPAAGNRLIAIDADGIAFVDDGGALRVGTPDVELSDAPTAISVAATVMTSTWQRDVKVVRCERWTNWAKRGDAVAYLTLA
jgi:Phage capsid family